jgi:ATP-dependent DNA ligase
MAFDLLYQDRRDVTARPLRDRRARLDDVVAGSELIFLVRRLAPGGLEAWEQVMKRCHDGYGAKDEASAYGPGPTRCWLKVKVPGWTDPEDRWRRLLTDKREERQ